MTVGASSLTGGVNLSRCAHERQGTNNYRRRWRRMAGSVVATSAFRLVRPRPLGACAPHRHVGTTLFFGGTRHETPSSSPQVALGEPELPVVVEMISGMRIGGKRRVLLPPSADLRPEAGGGEIAGDDTVRFDVEVWPRRTCGPWSPSGPSSLQDARTVPGARSVDHFGACDLAAGFERELGGSKMARTSAGVAAAIRRPSPAAPPRSRCLVRRRGLRRWRPSSRRAAAASRSTGRRFSSFYPSYRTLSPRTNAPFCGRCAAAALHLLAAACTPMADMRTAGLAIASYHGTPRMHTMCDALWPHV